MISFCVVQPTFMEMYVTLVGSASLLAHPPQKQNRLRPCGSSRSQGGHFLLHKQKKQGFGLAAPGGYFSPGRSLSPGRKRAESPSVASSRREDWENIPALGCSQGEAERFQARATRIDSTRRALLGALGAEGRVEGLWSRWLLRGRPFC